MAIIATDLIKKLNNLFPNRIIYEEQYQKHVGPLSYEIYKQAKAI